jgi:hypothetical protein
MVGRRYLLVSFAPGVSGKTLADCSEVLGKTVADENTA